MVRQILVKGDRNQALFVGILFMIINISMRKFHLFQDVDKQQQLPSGNANFGIKWYKA